ncbi:3203_t:CDS:2, partial [Entrophospora sp. SA101]
EDIPSSCIYKKIISYILINRATIIDMVNEEIVTHYGIRMANIARRTYTLFGVVGLPYLTVKKLTPMTLGNFTEKDSEEFISRLRTS